MNISSWDGYAYDVGSDPRGSKPNQRVGNESPLGQSVSVIQGTTEGIIFINCDLSLRAWATAGKGQIEGEMDASGEITILKESG